MKIEIDLIDDPKLYKIQFLIVDEYIKTNTIKSSTIDFLGIPVATTPQIKITGKNNGVKVKIKESYREFHVNCRRTEKEVYKFKIWNA